MFKFENLNAMKAFVVNVILIVHQVVVDRNFNNQSESHYDDLLNQLQRIPVNISLIMS